MAEIAEHYEEVDALLRSSLPSTIATSFQPANSTYTRLLEGSADEWRHMHHHTDSLTPSGTAGWMKRSLSEHFAEATDRTEEEETLLPDSADRLAARDKLARLALNGGYLSLFHQKLLRWWFDC
jgi:hypothetical protein